MLMSFRICLYKDLPDLVDRDINYFYFTYDKLILFRGQNQYYDPFIICDTIPDDPIINHLYIEMKTGFMRSLIGDSIVDVARVEDQSQMHLLRDIGTTYFMNADKRYIDQGSRTLQLPYYNGRYNMSVSMANDIRIDEKLVVRYDNKSEGFYIEGEHADIPNFKPYTGHITDSVATIVEEHTIRPEVRISNAPNNMVKLLRDGLYVGIDHKANINDFMALKSKYEQDRDKLSGILPELFAMVDDMEEYINPDSILAVIISATMNYISDIKAYTDEVFAKKTKEIQDVLNESIWGHF